MKDMLENNTRGVAILMLVLVVLGGVGLNLLVRQAREGERQIKFLSRENAVPLNDVEEVSENDEVRVYLAVFNTKDPVYEVFDVSELNRVERVVLEKVPSDVEVFENKLYISFLSEDVIEVIDPVAKRVEKRLRTEKPNKLFVDEKHIVVSKSDEDEVHVIDRERLSVVKTKVGDIPMDIVASSDAYYVVNEGSRDVSIVNKKNKLLVDTISVKSPVSSVDVREGFVLLAKRDEGEVIVLREKDKKSVERLGVGGSPSKVRVHPDGLFAYILSEGTGNVLMVSMAQLSVVEEFETGINPVDIVFHPSESYVYIANREDKTITVLNDRAKRVEGVMKTSIEPEILVVFEK